MNDHYNPWQRYERHRRSDAQEPNLSIAEYFCCMATTCVCTVVILVIFFAR